MSKAVGQFAPAPVNASRSPCPVVNALANHGYIERSGTNIYMNDLNAAMRKVGMSSLLGSVFARLIKNPYTFFDYFGCWKRSQMSSGKKYLNLVDLATHGAIEHDISLTRRDIAQPAGNNAPQQDLIEDMLDASSDGGENLSVDDLGKFIKSRIHQQLKDNPDLLYGPDQHPVNCGQVALMMHCFGNGKTIPCKYVRALFEDERLPEKEGWKKRVWWPMGLIEFFGAVRTLKTAVGVQFD
ncbi:hypothetical protein LTR78_001114 [Recurvomyces mirabilis]|uniref:Heme haloperoxidase family profile domain-containing protein n=1 Tax=Recurvomyces mirabilis TaxID=574656 RepID=A0AAE1C650_9PEZI|nr:hypothetical protein LTR78_001114 [Recurvomyces mirabilis]KAK5159086.1 hypothetical protein LTS14_003194 [Recurvomyces mirabilis]